MAVKDFMVDLTDDELVTLQSYDKIARTWASSHAVPDFWGDELLKFHQLLPEGKVLDVGCGGGRDAKELINFGYDYLGTDISSGLLEVARQQNPGGVFQKVSLYDLDFAGKFDGFWCAAVLLHIPKARINEALQAIKRSVRQDGIGFIAIKEGVGEVVELDNGLANDKRLFVYWQNDEFKKVLADYGFEVIDEEYRPMSERTKWLIYYVRIK